jgi:hypothetical protein
MIIIDENLCKSQKVFVPTITAHGYPSHPQSKI